MPVRASGSARGAAARALALEGCGCAPWGRGAGCRCIASSREPSVPSVALGLVPLRFLLDGNRLTNVCILRFVPWTLRRLSYVPLLCVRPRLPPPPCCPSDSLPHPFPVRPLPSDNLLKPILSRFRIICCAAPETRRGSEWPSSLKPLYAGNTLWRPDTCLPRCASTQSFTPGAHMELDQSHYTTEEQRRMRIVVGESGRGREAAQTHTDADIQTQGCADQDIDRHRPTCTSSQNGHRCKDGNRCAVVWNTGIWRERERGQYREYYMYTSGVVGSRSGWVCASGMDNCN
ncbi:hypothetical protein BD413DRAFT_196605 [Trametes elegans]|nr:hypothetical protein BD413DRAFT_196605 [Trametes elegans]